MKLLIIASVVLLFVSLSLADQPSSSSSSSSSNISDLNVENNENDDNTISNNNRKARFDEKFFRPTIDTRTDLRTFLSGRNILKSMLRLLFGTNEESQATSRQVLNMLVKVLDMLRSSFTLKVRQSRSHNFREAIDDAAVAGTSLLSGVIKSYLTTDEACVKKYLCESTRTATRDANEIGSIISQVGGYATSYLLQNQKSTPFDVTYEAIRKGRSGEDCAKIYEKCKESN